MWGFNPGYIPLVLAVLSLPENGCRRPLEKRRHVSASLVRPVKTHVHMRAKPIRGTTPTLIASRGGVR